MKRNLANTSRTHEASVIGYFGVSLSFTKILTIWKLNK